MIHSKPMTNCARTKKRTDARVYTIPKWKLRFIKRAGRYSKALILIDIPILERKSQLFEKLTYLKRVRHKNTLDFMRQ